MDWQEGYYRLFMSHIARRQSFVSEVKGHLEGFGIDGFVAHEDIEPSRSWVGEIIEAMETCEGLVAFYHEGFKASPWTEQEIGFCMAKGAKLLPLRFGEMPSGFIGQFQVIDGRNKNAVWVARQVFDALCGDPETRAAVEKGLVQAFADARSYREAIDRSKMLEAEISAWTLPMLNRIETATAENPEIANAWHVPERVQGILEANRADAAPF